MIQYLSLLECLLIDISTTQASKQASKQGGTQTIKQRLFVNAVYVYSSYAVSVDLQHQIVWCYFFDVLTNFFVCSHIWGQSTQSCQVLPSFESWGWTRNNGKIKPSWITIPEASKACYELIKCSCKKGCSGRCKCRQHQLACTEPCQCNGQCSIVWLALSFLHVLIQIREPIYA